MKFSLVQGFILSVSLLASGSALRAQDQPESGAHAATAAQNVEKDYVLHTDDEITVRSIAVKEIADKTFRIDPTGEVNFPLLGRIHVAGETVRESEAALTGKSKTFYLDPDIAITVATFHKEPVSVIGAVGTPGVHQMQGKMMLLDVLSAAGGIRADAGPIVRVTREKAYGSIPHPSAKAEGDTSVAEIRLKGLLDARDPADNIQLMPHDVVSIPPADNVYVVGNVKRSGGFPLSGKTSLTVLQALSLAEGLDVRAAPQNSKILRQGKELSAERTEIPVDVRAILAGKSQDVMLQPNDILFIPSSAAKTVSTRTVEAMIQVATGILIYH